MRPLIFIPLHNSKGKRDVTGAFLPEAIAFKLQHGGVVYSVDNSLPMARRRAEVLRKIERERDFFNTVAFFCHGWQDGIQLGFNRKNVRELARALFEYGALNDNDMVVALYCCSTGEDPQDKPLEAVGTGDNSFADKLRDALCEQGEINCRIVAHSTAGHTTQNPHVLYMDGMGSNLGGVGGYAPVGPKSKLWVKWKKALRTTDLRFRFPYMTVAEIHAELEGV